MIGGCRRMPGVQTPCSQPQAVSSVPKSQRGRRDARRWLFQDAPSAYGGTGPNVCYTALVLPPTESFCLYKTIPASAGGVTNIRACTSVRNMTALGGSVSATRFERLRRTLTFYRFLKPSPIARESAFRSNSSRLTDTLGKLFASGGVLSNLVSEGSNVDISYDSKLGTWPIHVLF